MRFIEKTDCKLSLSNGTYKKKHFPTYVTFCCWPFPLHAEWFQIYCRMGWQLTSNESCHTCRLCTGRTLITWQNCLFTRRQGNVKSLTKTLKAKLHWGVARGNRARFFVCFIAPRICRSEPCTSAELPDATKQTKNRARLLLATPQYRLALRLHVIVIEPSQYIFIHWK